MSTPDEDRCRQALRDACGETDGPMERHCRRLILFAEELADGRPYDRELVACAAWLHDIGLYPSVASEGQAYVSDGRRLAGELLAHWEPGRLRRCGDAIEYHHATGSQEAGGLEVELVRLADRIEVFGGVVRCGLPRATVKRIRREVSPRGLYAEIARGVARHARDRPSKLPRIFFPPGRA